MPRPVSLEQLPSVSAGQVRLTALLLHNLDDFVLALGAAENPDLALRDTEMLCQQSDDCLIRFAFPGRLLNFDYEAIAFLTDLFGPGVGLCLNLDFHSPILPVLPGYVILPV